MRFYSLYQFNDEQEMRDAGYEYRFPKISSVTWSEEDSPQWAYMGEGRDCSHDLHFRQTPFLRWRQNDRST